MAPATSMGIFSIDLAQRAAHHLDYSWVDEA